MCYCDQDKSFESCCQPYLDGVKNAPDAVSLMRSRYSAFVTSNKDYLLSTWHPQHAPTDLTFDEDQNWLGLKVLQWSSDDQQAEVKFIARYKIHGKAHKLEEHSVFCYISGRWYYLHAK